MIAEPMAPEARGAEVQIMTIDDMRIELSKYCNRFDLCSDGCRLRKPEGGCGWDERSNESIEGCYWFLVNEGLISKPEQSEINFVKVERNDEVERKTILETAKRYVCNDRNNQYGAPEDSFKTIADLWAGYLGTEISAKDVAAMMVLFKMARVRTGVGKSDNWIDAAGYCACGGEIEHKEAEKNGRE